MQELSWVKSVRSSAVIVGPSQDLSLLKCDDAGRLPRAYADFAHGIHNRVMLTEIPSSRRLFGFFPGPACLPACYYIPNEKTLVTSSRREYYLNFSIF